MKVKEKALDTDFSVYDRFPDAVAWHEPVLNEDGEAEDFMIRYGNEELMRISKATGSDVIDKKLSEIAYIDKHLAAEMILRMKKVYATDERGEYDHYSSLFEKHFNTVYVKTHGGVLTVIRDQTDQTIMALKAEQQQRTIENIIDTAPVCIALCKPVYENGTIQDFSFIKVNEKILNDLKMSHEQVLRLTYCDLHPEIRDNGYFNMMKTVAVTGERFKGEMNLPCFGGWFYVAANRIERDRIAVFCVNISETKAVHDMQKELTDQLSAILDSSLHGICAMEAVVDDKDNIRDFIYTSVNKKFVEITGLQPDQVIGSFLSTVYPHHDPKVFEQMGTVVKEQRQVQTEVSYQYNDMVTWFSVSMSSMGSNGLVCSFEDITAKKAAQLEAERQSKLLDNIFRFSPAGITVSEMIRNAEGEIIDFQTVIANDISEQFTGLSKERTLTLRGSEIIPDILDSDLMRTAKSTLQTGIPFETEYFLEPTQRWLRLSVSKLDEDRLINVFTDITEQKNLSKNVSDAK